MIKVDLTLEDTRILADRTTMSPSWSVTISDALTGNSRHLIMSDNEFTAMCALGIHGDGEPLNPDVTAACYKACEHLFVGHPFELRPIP